jgi:DNA-binding transcriptional MerR regulator
MEDPMEKREEASADREPDASDPPGSGPMPDSDEGERAAKKYYTISEVSEMLQVKPHVLRYWESQFPLLRPKKNRGGFRAYQERDLDMLRSIQQMLHERGYTIAGARRHLNNQHRKRAVPEVPQMDLDFLSPADRKQLRLIREELVRLRDWLTKP